MTLSITLQPDVETRFREEAESRGVSVDQLASQRLLEAELLWRIRIAAPDDETRLLRRLIRGNRVGKLTEAEVARLQTLLDEREERAAQRLNDVVDLARLRSMPVRQLMGQLGIHPLAAP